MLKYKDYTGLVEIDEDAGILHGRVLGLRDEITFQGETVQEARKAFEDSVDDYLEYCAERGETPEKPYSGKFLVRIRPELHRQLSGFAEASRLSLNAAVEHLLTTGITSLRASQKFGKLRDEMTKTTPDVGEGTFESIPGTRLRAAYETRKHRIPRKVKPRTKDKPSTPDS